MAHDADAHVSIIIITLSDKIIKFSCDLTKSHEIAMCLCFQLALMGQLSRYIKVISNVTFQGSIRSICPATQCGVFPHISFFLLTCVFHVVPISSHKVWAMAEKDMSSLKILMQKHA